MQTFSQLRDDVTSLLAETSVAFWSTEDRNDALNRAQRHIAALAGGVPANISDSFSNATPYVIVLDDDAIRMWPSQVMTTANGRALNVIDSVAASRLDPQWATREGTPRWGVWDSGQTRLYFVPKPEVAAGSVAVTFTIATMPAEMSGDDDYPFNDHPAFEQFQTALVNYAVGLALMKQHYDDDANRFLQLANAELGALLGSGDSE